MENLTFLATNFFFIILLVVIMLLGLLYIDYVFEEDTLC